MQIPLSLFLAIRNLTAKRDNSFISFVAFVSTVGLILGVAALITVMSVLNGFERELKDKLLGFIPHVQIYKPSIDTNWQTTLEQIKVLDANIDSVTPNLNTQVMLVNHKNDSTTKKSGQQTQVLTLMGIAPAYETNWVLAGSAKDGQGMIAGNLDSITSPNQKNIVIGQTTADNLNLKLGDGVQVIFQKSSDSAIGIEPVSYQFYVSGIYKLTAQTEKYIAFTSINNTADVLGTQNGVNGFKVQLKDVFLANKTTKNLQSQLPDDTIYNWQQTHGNIYETLQMQKNLMALLLLMIILVAGFNLVSSLVMNVTEKRTEIAILKTIGASPRLIQAVFFWQGFLIACVGTTAGVVLGLLLSYNIGWLSNWVNTTFELGLFDSYYVTKLPSEVRLLDVLLICVSSILIASLATLYPSKKAAKLAPAEALRYD